MDLLSVVKKAQEASYSYAILNTKEKNVALKKIADMLLEQKEEILKSNFEDVKKAQEKGLNQALVDRLTLNESRFEEMVSGVLKVASLDDPVGTILSGRDLENGLKLYKKRVPLGVIGVIYEARPNVTIDIAALCLKSGNACVLRGGSEAINTNLILHKILCEALDKVGISKDGVALISDPDRNLVGQMLKLDDYIDVIIPRGGEALQRLCRQEASIPVITGGFGISHIFVDACCDTLKSVSLIVNAKVQKPSACNALDTLLIHKQKVDDILVPLLKALEPYKVSLVAHNEIYEKIKDLDYPYVELGDESSFDNEFLSLTMNIAIVDNINSACSHLKKHRASHSDSILTDSYENAQRFVLSAPSACVYVNASTRFTDGGQFGLGAEVAISTQKLHARGPMALEELTTTQYVGSGDYLVRS